MLYSVHYIMRNVHYMLDQVLYIIQFSHYIMHTIQHIIKCEQDIMTMMNQMFNHQTALSFHVMLRSESESEWFTGNTPN